MNTQASHIIHKLTVDIEVNSIDTANDIKDHSNEWIRDMLTNALLKCFSEVDQKYSDHFVQLDALTLDLNLDQIDAHNLVIIEHELDRKLAKLISPIFEQNVGVTSINSAENRSSTAENYFISPDVSGKIVHTNHRTIESFIYFLNSGNKPWWIVSNEEFSSMLNEEKLLTLFKKEPKFFTNELNSIIGDLRCVKRLVHQFSLNFNWQLCAIVLSELRGIEPTAAHFSFELYQQLIGNSETKSVETTFVFLHSLYHMKKSHDFELQLYQILSTKPLLIYSSSEVSYAKIFKTITLISAFMRGKSTSLSSFEALEISVAKTLSKKLNVKELKELVLSGYSGEMADHALRVFERKLEELYALKKEDIYLSEMANESDNSNIQNSLTQSKEKSKVQEKREEMSENSDKSVLGNLTEFPLLQDDNEKPEPFENTIEEDNVGSASSLLTENVGTLEVEKEINRTDESDSSTNETSPKEQAELILAVNDQDLKPKQTDKKTIEPIFPENSTEVPNDDHTIKALNTTDLNKSELDNPNSLPDNSADMNTLFSTLANAIESTKAMNEKLVDHPFLAENGGLILLHPFLPSLFKNVKFLSDDNIIIEPDRAIHLLHFLATGKQAILEHHLKFEKYLCNLPSNFVTKKEIILSEEEIEEVNHVLSAVKEHWKKMTNSPVELIQNEFLKRNCKIETGEKTDRIKMEKKPFDLLLDSLPWSINMVKLPWKKELIFVEW